MGWGTMTSPAVGLPYPFMTCLRRIIHILRASLDVAALSFGSGYEILREWISSCRCRVSADVEESILVGTVTHNRAETTARAGVARVATTFGNGSRL